MTLEAENAALRARIAELEAPVLPETVRQVVEQSSLYIEPIRAGSYSVESSEEAEGLYLTAEWIEKAAALLTRLSSVTEEDVERVAREICDARLWRGAWEKANEVERNAFLYEARAALTAHLTGERGD